MQEKVEFTLISQETMWICCKWINLTMTNKYCKNKGWTKNSKWWFNRQKWWFNLVTSISRCFNMMQPYRDIQLWVCLNSRGNDPSSLAALIGQMRCLSHAFFDSSLWELNKYTHILKKLNLQKVISLHKYCTINKNLTVGSYIPTVVAWLPGCPPRFNLERPKKMIVG